MNKKITNSTTKAEVINKKRNKLCEDEYYPQAEKLIIKYGHTSPSMLQRMLNIGYVRATRLAEEYERRNNTNRQ